MSDNQINNGDDRYSPDYSSAPAGASSASHGASPSAPAGSASAPADAPQSAPTGASPSGMTQPTSHTQGAPTYTNPPQPYPAPMQPSQATQQGFAGAPHNPNLPFFQQETLKSWVVTLLLTGVGSIIWLAILAFADFGSEVKKTYAKASLVVVGISIAIGIIIMIIFWIFAIAVGVGVSSGY